MTTRSALNSNRAGLIILSIASYCFMCGNNPNCDPTALPTLSCHTPELVITPGTCVAIEDPCGDHEWKGRPYVDAFDLCDNAETGDALVAGVYLRTHRDTAEDPIRELCVAPNTSFVDQRVDFYYGHSTDEVYNFGLGYFRVWTAEPLAANISISQDPINPGDTTTLTVNVTGGVPPYSYQWTPRGGLDSDRDAIVHANPPFTVQYEVGVTDSVQARTTATIIVHVSSDLEVTADPPSVDASAISQLTAIVRGGLPPYTFAWDPVATLNDPTSEVPVATPSVTTTYNVTVTDSAGVQMQSGVTVRVNMAAVASATPDTISTGQTSQLDVIVVGGLPPYDYEWTPPDHLVGPSLPNPVASPTVSTLYSVMISDSEGFSTNSDVTVTVANSTPAPVASFTFSVVCCPTLNLDASASSGTIVSYSWDLSWTGPGSDRITTTPQTSFTIRETDHGTISLTVVAADGQTATSSIPF